MASIANTVQKLQADKVAASALTTLAPSAGGQSSGGTMEQQIRELAAKTVPPDSANGGPAAPTATRDDGKESERRADQPPVAWPTFPPDHPLGKPTRKRTPSEALALAKDIAERWEHAKSAGDVTMRPSPDEIKEACRALLMIDPKASEYQQAWAAFSQLRKMDSDIAMK